MTRRRRTLTSEERKLWSFVARGVTPLKGRASSLDPEPLAEEAPPPSHTEPARRSPPARLDAGPPPLVPLDRRTVSALRRGRQGVEAAIDLHGLRQSEAHAALRGFLHRSHGAGLKLVLVITGKGAAGAHDTAFEERGVLRRVVPHWLRLPDLRPLILGFEEAAPHHGGAGALYVRLRRQGKRDVV